MAIVNEAFAKKFNLGNDAVGKRMGDGGPNDKLDTEIVGLVKDAKYSEVKDAIPPLFFRPYRQDERVGSLTFYVRTVGRARTDHPDHPAPGRDASIRTCRSRTCGPWSSRCATTCSSIG